LSIEWIAAQGNSEIAVVNGFNARLSIEWIAALAMLLVIGTAPVAQARFNARLSIEWIAA